MKNSCVKPASYDYGCYDKQYCGYCHIHEINSMFVKEQKLKERKKICYEFIICSYNNGQHYITYYKGYWVLYMVSSITQVI